MPFVQSIPGALTLATIFPPGHMQKEWAEGAAALARLTRL
jgi:hypothetical protein